MSKFKIGDYVKVIAKTSGQKYINQIGCIKEIKSYNNGSKIKYYYLLDIDVLNSGIWETDLEFSKRNVKVYGIVLFCLNKI
jgi:hypothetical protein